MEIITPLLSEITRCNIRKNYRKLREYELESILLTRLKRQARSISTSQKIEAIHNILLEFSTLIIFKCMNLITTLTIAESLCNRNWCALDKKVLILSDGAIISNIINRIIDSKIVVWTYALFLEYLRKEPKLSKFRLIILSNVEHYSIEIQLAIYLLVQLNKKEIISVKVIIVNPFDDDIHLRNYFECHTDPETIRESIQKSDDRYLNHDKHKSRFSNVKPEYKRNDDKSREIFENQNQVESRIKTSEIVNNREKYIPQITPKLGSSKMLHQSNQNVRRQFDQKEKVQSDQTETTSSSSSIDVLEIIKKHCRQDGGKKAKKSSPKDKFYR